MTCARQFNKLNTISRCFCRLYIAASELDWQNLVRSAMNDKLSYAKGEQHNRRNGCVSLRLLVG
jgi:ferredoxin-thioredoxin reductase catalytic subunit